MKNIKKIIEKELMHLKIYPDNYGFTYAVTAIEKVIKEPESIHMITKNIYPYVAEMHNTKDSRVERAIRHQLEKMFADSSVCGNVAEIFPNCKKVTVGQFIAVMAIRIKDMAAETE